MGRRDCSIFAIFVLKLPFPLIVLTAGIAGYLASKKYPELFSSAGGHKASQKIMVRHILMMILRHQSTLNSIGHG